MAASGPEPVAGRTQAALLRRVLWVGVALQLAGTAIDLRWHATHEEFETAGDQVQAHFVLWLGVLVILAVSALAVRRTGPERGNVGYVLAAVSGTAYAIASVWHFIEHANGSDPAAAHVVLYIFWALVLAGAVTATVLSRRLA